MSQFIRTRVWNPLKMNQFLLNYRSSPVSLSRKLVTLSRQFSQATHDDVSVSDAGKKESEIIIDANQAGRLIGRRGMNIRQINKVSNCHVALDAGESMDDAGNPTGKRRVSISGESEHDIAGAKQVIEDVLTNENAFLNEALECEIAKSLIGRLLGRDGWNINRLSIDHDCHISVDDGEDHEDGNVKVNFFGGVENCTEARKAVLFSLDAEGDKNLGVSISVPESLAGLIIGQSGSTINVLKRLTKCELGFEDREGDEEIDISQDRTLIIRGSEGDCEDARTVIAALLNLFKRHKDAGELVGRSESMV